MVTRVSLGEPELIFSGLSRSEVLGRIRKLGDDGGGELTTEARGEDVAKLRSLDTLRKVAHACTRCGLHVGRKQVVFGEGDPRARVVCVGEAPGAVEDETGRPFVGRAGQLLDRLLLSVGFDRTSVYICNVLKCRPPRNRDPQPDEVQSCSPFLLRQLELIDPEVIVAFGAFAARTLLGTRAPLGRLRGRTHVYEGYPVVVTYHPAALLRNPSWTRPTWEDMQKIRAIVAAGKNRGVDDHAGTSQEKFVG